jgi:hypothetical protein
MSIAHAVRVQKMLRLHALAPVTVLLLIVRALLMDVVTVSDV